MASRARSLAAHTVAFAALLFGAVAVASEAGLFHPERIAGSGPSIAERPTQKIRVHGKVRGLYPGRVKSLRVRVRNLNRYPVTLVSVRARDSKANVYCSKRHFRARRFLGRVRIPARGRIRVEMRARLKPSAPDACQEATFPIRYRARVTRNRRPR